MQKKDSILMWGLLVLSVVAVVGWATKCEGTEEHERVVESCIQNEKLELCRAEKRDDRFWIKGVIGCPEKWCYGYTMDNFVVLYIDFEKRTVYHLLQEMKLSVTILNYLKGIMPWELEKEQI